ncbi:MAG: PEP-CTERM sorting domain-containing protein [Pseudomonadales bacterium]|nr:PEP-CTERM sorting domain-containing protein [Pseudomonadales bacterium]
MKLKTTALLVGSVFAATANASSFFLTVDQDYNGDLDATTGSISELGYSGTLSTSFYADPMLSVGSQVIDTNIASEMLAAGFINGTTSSDGLTTFKYPTISPELNIDALNYQSPFGDHEGFQSNPGWGLTYQFKLIGSVIAGGVEYTDGWIDVFYNKIPPMDNDLANAFQTQVARINVTGSDLNVANLNVFGEFSFDFDGNGTDDAVGDTFVQNFFTDVDSGQSYYNAWSNGAPINFVLDTNVNPPVPTLGSLALTSLGGVMRQTTQDGSATMSVPEPGSLILIGAGLLGLGVSSSRKRKA